MKNYFEKLKIDSAAQQGHSWYNTDLLPTKSDERTWTVYNYLFFYFTTSLTPSSYTIGATLVSMGLLWWHGLICAAVGSFFLSIILVINSRASSKYHLGFPAIVRAPAGMYGSYFFIFVRVSVASIYFAVQTYFAGKLMSVMLKAIFGHKWVNIENKLPESSEITSSSLLAFFIVWIIQLPLIFMHPTIQRHLYTVKAITTTTTLFGVFGYCVRKAGGLGTPESLASNRVYGSDLGWGIVYGINSIMGALCPILINAGDVVRYARKTEDAAWVQSFAVLFSKVLITFLGCGTTSAAKVFLGKTFWNPWDLYDALLDYHWTAGMRTAMVFSCFGMILALVIVNIGTNCLPVGADTTGMFPKYMTIVRGQFLCWLVCPLFFPWKMISSGARFIAFLGSYSIMLCPIAAVMVYDYYFVRKGNFHILSFYNPNHKSMLWYGNKYGVNPRAIIAWIIAVGSTISGVANSINKDSIPTGATHVYQLGFLLSFSIAFVIYAILNYFFPVQMCLPEGYDLKTIKFEEFARTDGLLEHETYNDIILEDISLTDEDKSSIVELITINNMPKV
ncbi:hypothetical protein C6P40_003446 [Pichia californica]|uniref:Allantoin permease n=1 Tax=Pichia californica TaxID=460514 RepID=A0A9P6WNJ1_9ASCO|nr:hypothetical protein C6P42_002534 [[Candida] californica]KAG0690250.1 hypothetical protein C6P40_003446 [[Candida] californica]